MQLHKAEAMFQEDRSSVFRLPEPLRKIQRFIFLMIVFLHWIIRQMWTLRRALKEETKDATVIIVAQRISTILHADQIIVLDEGRIAGIGTHEELLKNCEVYYQIASSQLSEQELKNAISNQEEKQQEITSENATVNEEGGADHE